MRRLTALTALPLLALLGALACAEEAPPPPADKYVTREEYNELQKQMATILAELQALKAQAPQAADATLQKRIETLEAELQATRKALADRAAEDDQTLDELDKRLKAAKEEADAVRPGNTKAFFTGYGFAGYTAKQGESSTFSAGFNPIFLYKLSDRVMFESELEFTLSGDHTDTSLEYANLSYLLTDHLTLGAGKFLMPFGIFNERLHPAWINKLPNRPLPYDDDVGIAPESGVGAFARGGAPLGSTKFNYAAYITNGPSLTTDNAGSAGQLDFANFDDTNNNKAVGGRIGFLPVPQLELGYSAQYAEVNPSGFRRVSAFLQAGDISYLRDFKSLRGAIDARAEWVFSNVQRVTYDPDGALGFGPLSFPNNRNAGYAQLAYRPTLVNSRILKKMEFIGRYDVLNVSSNAPGSAHEERWALGLDYWIMPNVVIKTAYQIGHKSGADQDNTFFIQAAVGF
jgi:hypothetical protein